MRFRVLGPLDAYAADRDASFLPLDGRFHLPDAADLDRIEAAMAALLHPAS